MDRVSDGVLVSSDNDSFNEYVIKRKHLSKTDNDIIQLKTEINMINGKLNNITSLLEKIAKGI